jgi:hypothetical protein
MGKLKNITKQPTDEKQERALALVERYRIILSDTDARFYVIPVWQTSGFLSWDRSRLDASEIYDGEGFKDYVVDNGKVLTFLDPRED